MTHSSDSGETNNLLDRIAAGDPYALEQLLRLHRDYLWRVVQMRMAPALTARVDASDVVQEAQLVIARRIADFLERRPTSFRLWIRRKALEQLITQRRRHIGAQRRSTLKEDDVSNMSSLAIARNLLANTPSKILRRIELQEQVRDLIDQLGDQHREILTLRHGEGLTNSEAADVLGISPSTARKRHGRALRQLHLLCAKRNISFDGSEGVSHD